MALAAHCPVLLPVDWAAGRNVEESIRDAKAYLSAALNTGLDLGQGNGPLDHCWMCSRTASHDTVGTG